MDSARLVIAFTALGHAVHHIVTALFLTIVLVLTPLWGRPFEELIALWTLGALLIGLGSPFAGWLADRIGSRVMMLVFFLGIGMATMLCGFARTPEELRWALALVGLFGAIYHPVGTAWVVSNVEQKGRAIAFVGFAGSVGVAVASLIAGGLTEFLSWRAAFIIPGLVVIAAGLLLALLIAKGVVPERNTRAEAALPMEAGQLRLGAIVLVAAMCISAVAWHAFTTLLPKWLNVEIGPVFGASLTGVGGVVAAVYLLGTLAQFIGGHLADRGHAKSVYVASFALKAAVLVVATMVFGKAVLPLAVLIVFFFDLGSPVENILIARYAPSNRRGLAYGLRHGLAIVSAPLGVELVSRLYDPTTGFRTLFLTLAVLATATFAVSLALPSERAAADTATPQPAR